MHSPVPESPSSFAQLAISPALQEVVAELGFRAMTPIQAQSIPLLLQGYDLIGQSKTGSGKTAAFTLPILDRIRVSARQVQALVLCPTRELCGQVAREMRKLARRHPGLQVLVLAGGEPGRPQAVSLESGVHIVVGTPGRTLDHINRGNLDLTTLRYLVLDEADRMLDMGFADEMEKILEAAPQNRQTIFFSATFPASIEEMSARYQKQAQRVTIDEGAVTAPSVKQIVVEINPENKLSALHGLLDQYRPETAIVFSNHKAAIAEITKALGEWGVSAAGLHGDLEQMDRDKVMAKLRNRSIRVLVATDVAARGIDVADLDLVINYDLPLKPDTYVHRIGRTGRAGKEGIAISMATPRERLKIEAIETYTGSSFEREKIQLPKQEKALYQGAAMTTLSIGGGRKDKLRPGDILGALTGEAGGLDAKDIGKIEIHDRVAYVAVAQSLGRIAVERLREGRIKGRKFSVDWVR
ncbi:MAG: ATP-dependent RNA helicase DbpA [Pseudobdellovibrionaceae bacterium]|uniref:ATP-dependent RNA helicase DbpA n=1 Tax=Oligoflexus sp. TaxID=1971216 RepID=UPI0027C42EB2|nr:ATP-dependent RNA helicase DbpA [Oligoflexus sp.]MDQ3231642.1 ATP-dependent RNA helicase DbpA [Pseudobdellovibrionaceae bacterium]HYX34771.1 ATP-dependent RNA helicase DbpA [Oligoflexus sp.]